MPVFLNIPVWMRQFLIVLDEVSVKIEIDRRRAVIQFCIYHLSIAVFRDPERVDDGNTDNVFLKAVYIPPSLVEILRSCWVEEDEI